MNMLHAQNLSKCMPFFVFLNFSLTFCRSACNRHSLATVHKAKARRNWLQLSNPSMVVGATSVHQAALTNYLLYCPPGCSDQLSPLLSTRLQCQTLYFSVHQAPLGSSLLKCLPGCTGNISTVISTRLH